jgi:hypothetical protein
LDEEDSIFNRKLSTIYLMKNLLRSVLEEKMERGGFSVYGWGVGKIGSELHFCAKWIESKNRPVNSTEGYLYRKISKVTTLIKFSFVDLKVKKMLISICSCFLSNFAFQFSLPPETRPKFSPQIYCSKLGYSVILTSKSKL